MKEEKHLKVKHIRDSEFSKFFREASPEEKEKVMLEVAKKATEDQRKIMNSPQVEKCEPTIVDLNDTMFNAVWSAIKKWDISRSQNMEGRRMYAGATGTDVMTILNVVRPFLLQARADERREIKEELVREIKLRQYGKEDSPIMTGYDMAIRHVLEVINLIKEK